LIVGEEKKAMSRGKATLVDNALVLALMGILAGALGGLAVGLIMEHPTAAAPTTAK
jgi:hypothetical protein